MSKLKITNFCSRRFAVGIYRREDGIVEWGVMDTETLAETKTSTDFEHYRSLKRTWRRSKEEFEALCKFMEFKDLFSTAGVKI